MSKEEGMEELLRKAGYSEKAIDYYMNKLNVGAIAGADAADSHMGLCGDSMRIYLKIQEGTIKDAKFQAIGCAGAFASGSALTEIVKEKKLEEAIEITEEDVMAYLGKMPGPKRHCVHLAIESLRKAIESYTRK